MFENGSQHSKTEVKVRNPKLNVQIVNKLASKKPVANAAFKPECQCSSLSHKKTTGLTQLLQTSYERN